MPNWRTSTCKELRVIVFVFVLVLVLVLVRVLMRVLVRVFVFVCVFVCTSACRNEPVARPDNTAAESGDLAGAKLGGGCEVASSFESVIRRLVNAAAAPPLHTLRSNVYVCGCVCCVCGYVASSVRQQQHWFPHFALIQPLA